MLLTLNIDIFNILNTFTVKTGGGGYHYYFKYTKCEQLKNHIGLLKCIDIRTQSGGQVVGPYSIHPITKQFYMPIDPMKEVSEIPDWLLNILLQASKQNNNNTINTINNNIQIDRNIIQQNSKNTIIDIENLFNLLSNERADNYEQQINVLFVLKNIVKDYNEEQLVELWHRFSAKSSKYNQLECERTWTKQQIRQEGAKLEIGSLHFWAKEDNLEEYKILFLIKLYLNITKQKMP